MIKILIAISVLLFGCALPKYGGTIHCNDTPEHPVCKWKCTTDCTKVCRRSARSCTPAQLKELKETGRVKDKT